MSDWYKHKDKSDISSPDIKRLQNLINKHTDAIAKVRAKCAHHFEVLSSGDGWDGYSWVNCEVEEHVHCTICGETMYRKTGQINHH